MIFDRNLIAVDIGTSSIKVVEFAGKIKKKLQSVGLETIPKGIINQGNIADEGALVVFLKEMFKKMKITTTGRRAAISLGGNAVIIKRVKMNRVANQNFEEQVFYEAEQHLQHDISELYFRYHEITTDKSAEEAQIVLVGARRDTVEQYISCIRQSGMRIGVVDCDAFAISNMFEFNYGVAEQLSALVNIGATSTQISLISNGEFLYVRDVPIGGEQYTARITEEMQVERDNAETLKISASVQESSTPPQVLNIIKEVNEQLINEVKVTIDYYFQSGEAPINLAEVSFIFLCGGGSRLLGLDSALSADLKLPVQVINPFHRIEVNPKRFDQDYILGQGQIYGVAVGLGLRAMHDNVA